MADRVTPGPVQADACIREATCVHINKIFDSCQSKDCIEDLRLYPTAGSQAVIDRALSIKSGHAKLLYTYLDVEPVNFKHGFYTIDMRFYYLVTAEAFVGAPRPLPVAGLAIFDKRSILFGGEGSVHSFSSTPRMNAPDIPKLPYYDLPTAYLEVVDPIVLSAKLTEGGRPIPEPCEPAEIPAAICGAFDEDLVFQSPGKRVYVTLGQFSILRLERDTQLLMPVYDNCMPDKECTAGGCPEEEDPCEVFQQVEFPVEEFFPSSVPPFDPGGVCFGG